MIIENCKEYNKLNPSNKKAVDKCIKKLEKRYKYYQSQNVVITNLFGDDNIIHKIIDDKFYVYKSHCGKLQVRLLYKVDDDDNIDVMYFYIKNNDDLVNIKGRRQTRYLTMFEDLVKNYKEGILQ